MGISITLRSMFPRNQKKFEVKAVYLILTNIGAKETKAVETFCFYID